MRLLEKIKKVLFTEDTISQQFTIQKMKEEIENIKSEYNILVGYQDLIKKKPECISTLSFEKKPKYIELMDNLKYKNVMLIKDFELYALKYNILIELYLKLKKYIESSNGEVIVEFNTDKYKQPVAVASHNTPILHKIELIKNTLLENDYLTYMTDKHVEILDITSKEPNINHGTFMMSMMLQNISNMKMQGSNLNKIIVSEKLVNKLGANCCKRFFGKFEFIEEENQIIKYIKYDEN